MTSDPSVSFSDREVARAAAARLRGETVTLSAAAEPAFVRFRASGVVGAPAPAAPLHVVAAPRDEAGAPPFVAAHDAHEEAPPAPRPAVARAVPRLPAPPAGAASYRTWEILLGWCEEAGLASFAFVLDAQGLMVASRGTPPFGEVEAMGGRLMLCVEYGLHLANAATSSAEMPAAVAVDLGGRWLTGFRVGPPQVGPITVGIVGPGPLRGELRSVLSTWVTTALGV